MIVALSENVLAVHVSGTYWSITCSVSNLIFAFCMHILAVLMNFVKKRKKNETVKTMHIFAQKPSLVHDKVIFNLTLNSLNYVNFVTSQNTICIIYIAFASY